MYRLFQARSPSLYAWKNHRQGTRQMSGLRARGSILRLLRSAKGSVTAGRHPRRAWVPHGPSTGSPLRLFSAVRSSRARRIEHRSTSLWRTSLRSSASSELQPSREPLATGTSSSWRRSKVPRARLQPTPATTNRDVCEACQGMGTRARGRG
jgi:hypothetical protein